MRARGLRAGWPGRTLFDGLDFEIRPGLTLVRGGDGTGKSTLLRVMADRHPLQAGTLERPGGTPLLPDPADPRCDPVRARDWLDTAYPRRATAPVDDPARDALVAGFGLVGHLDKALYMLSTGTRRKLGLVVALCGDAPLTLLDMPFAALDGPSGALLARRLAQAARDRARGWVIADHECPEALDGVPLAGLIDLGD